MAKAGITTAEIRLTGKAKSLYQDLVKLSSQRSKFSTKLLKSLGGEKDLISQMLRLTQRTQDVENSRVKKISQRYKYEKQILEFTSNANDILKQEVDNVDEFVKSLKGTVPYAKELEEIEQTRLEIQRSYWGANKQIGDELIKQLDLQKRTVKQASSLQTSSGIVESSYDNLNSSLGGILTKFPKIIIAAKALALNPMFLAVTGILILLTTMVKLLGRAWGQTKLLNRGMVDFRKETGLTIIQTEKIKQNVENIYLANRKLLSDYDNIGKVYEGVSGIYDAFSEALPVSEQLIRNALILNANFGISGEIFGKSLQTLRAMSSASEESSLYMLDASIQLAEISGVSAPEVFADIAGSSGEILTFMRGNRLETLRTAIEARRLGTNMSELTSTTDSLLDFQSSISDEMNASAIIGQQLNLSAARQYGFEGKLLDQRTAILDAVRQTGDFDSRNAIEKEAIAKAVSMTVSELSKALLMDEAIGAMTEEQLEQYNAIEDSLKVGINLRKDNIDEILGELELQKNQLELEEERKNALYTAIDAFTYKLIPIMEDLQIRLTNFMTTASEWVVKLDPLVTVFSTIASIITDIKIMWYELINNPVTQAFVKTLDFMGRVTPAEAATGLVKSFSSLIPGLRRLNEVPIKDRTTSEERALAGFEREYNGRQLPVPEPVIELVVEVTVPQPRNEKEVDTRNNETVPPPEPVIELVVETTVPQPGPDDGVDTRINETVPLPEPVIELAVEVTPPTPIDEESVSKAIQELEIRPWGATAEDILKYSSSDYENQMLKLTSMLIERVSEGMTLDGKMVSKHLAHAQSVL